MPNGFQLLPRDGRFRGLGYQALISDWMTWLTMNDPDNHNDGPVVYLRGLDFPDSDSPRYTSFVRIGDDRFIISPQQAIFWPIIMYYVDQKHHPHAETSHDRLTQLTNLINNAPPRTPGPRDALISFERGPEQPIHARGYADYMFIADSEVELEIPRQDYNDSKTICPYLDVPLTIPGTTRCRVAGYFLLLTFNQVGTYTISSKGRGELGYETVTLVDVQVTEQRSSNRATLIGEKRLRRLS